ncbi:MAG: MBL fold metallo-hydrolase [Promethearchaeota archaeon]|nr:MAG: MBL fold metallo-hydrolase [Candidatus Lokiarchaeota archaeon]
MLDCNQYILVNTDTNELSLFDAGNGISLKGLIEGMQKIGLSYNDITQIFLTHEHVDHVLGLYPLIKLLQDSPPQIYAYGETRKILETGDETKIFPGNLGINPSMFGVEIIPLNIIELKDKPEIQITPDFKFRIYYTPGHSLGSISYYEPKRKILIPGDLVFTGGSFGRYDFPGGSLKVLTNSIKLVNDLDVKYLLPGHMGISSNGNQEIASSYRMVRSISSFY